jgi:hypothetical protein
MSWLTGLQKRNRCDAEARASDKSGLKELCGYALKCSHKGVWQRRYFEVRMIVWQRPSSIGLCAGRAVRVLTPVSAKQLLLKLLW